MMRKDCKDFTKKKCSQLCQIYKLFDLQLVGIYILYVIYSC